jgi:hypothetical protein
LVESLRSEAEQLRAEKAELSAQLDFCTNQLNAVALRRPAAPTLSSADVVWFEDEQTKVDRRATC